MSRLRKAGIAGILTAAGVLVVATVGDFEGLRTSAYPDVIGIPTICYGETRGVRLGDRRTVAECKAMLGDRLVAYKGADFSHWVDHDDLVAALTPLVHPSPDHPSPDLVVRQLAEGEVDRTQQFGPHGHLKRRIHKAQLTFVEHLHLVDQQADGLDIVGERLPQEVDPGLFQDGHHRGVVDVLVHVNIRPPHPYAGGKSVSHSFPFQSFESCCGSDAPLRRG